jgi:hypothetical protein
VVGAQQLRSGASSLASGSQCGSFGWRRDDGLLAEQRGAAEVSRGRVTDESVQGGSDGPQERRQQGGRLREADRHPAGGVAVPDALISAPSRTGHGIDAAVRMNLSPVGRQVSAVEQRRRDGPRA